MARDSGFETRLTQREVSAVRTSDGAWNISAVVGGYRHHKTYYGYSKHDAIREFIRWVKREQPNPGGKIIQASLRDDKRKAHPPLFSFQELTLNDVLSPDFGREQLYLMDRGGFMGRVRRNGKVKTWKRDPTRVEIPLKFGLYEAFRITDPTELHVMVGVSERENPGVRRLEAYASYRALDDYLGGKDQRTLAHNTVVVRVDDRHIGVVLHHTRIVMFDVDDAITLNSGGYHTVTTKQRINQFIRPHGWSLYSKDWDWFVEGHGEKYDFYDNMVIGGRGHPAMSNPRHGRTQQRPSPDDAYPDPGKFEGESNLAEEMYEAALNGEAEEEGGDVQGPGYYWLMVDFEASDGTPRHGILSEDSQGFVSLTEYDTPTDAYEAWEQDIEPVLDEWYEGEEG